MPEVAIHHINITIYTVASRPVSFKGREARRAPLWPDEPFFGAHSRGLRDPTGEGGMFRTLAHRRLVANSRGHSVMPLDAAGHPQCVDALTALWS